MGAFTQQYLTDLETRMQIISENEYVAFASNTWWPRVMRKRPTESAKEIIQWLLTTASIEDLGPIGGKMAYDEILSQIQQYETRFAGKGLKLRKSQFEDVDGNGLDLAAKWVGDIGAYMAYWPQKRCTTLLKNGHLSASLAYDGVPFFSASHPVLGLKNNTSKGIFANVFTGSAAGTAYTVGANPGAMAIDDSVDLDTAITNLSKIFAYIRGIKMPNGVDPRYLRPELFIAPPRMQQRIVQLTKAKFIAQAVGSAGGSADVEDVIRSFGFSEPIIADELGGNATDDSTCYLVCRQLSQSQLGGLLLLEREAFSISYYTGAQLPDLRRMNELEWLTQGRYGDGYGHPFVIFKICKT